MSLLQLLYPEVTLHFEWLPATFLKYIADLTGFVFSVSYGAEILPYHMRLKGLSIMLSVQSVAQAFVRPSRFPTPLLALVGVKTHAD